MFFKKINKIKTVVQNQTRNQQIRAIVFFKKTKANIAIENLFIDYFDQNISRKITFNNTLGLTSILV